MSKSLPKLKSDLQNVFNEYIRLRDKDKPCISCNKPVRYKQAGHYFPVGNFDRLRYDENNCHGECIKCNNFDDSHLIGYGRNLPNRIGEDRYQKLLADAVEYRKNGNRWSRTDLMDLLTFYKQQIKDLS